MPILTMFWIAVISLICMLACAYAVVASPGFQEDIQTMLTANEDFVVKGIGDKPTLYLFLAYFFLIIFVISLVSILVQSNQSVY